jgi:hypothetical protein
MMTEGAGLGTQHVPPLALVSDALLPGLREALAECFALNQLRVGIVPLSAAEVWSCWKSRHLNCPDRYIQEQSGRCSGSPSDLLFPRLLCRRPACQTYLYLCWYGYSYCCLLWNPHLLVGSFPSFHHLPWSPYWSIRRVPQAPGRP